MKLTFCLITCGEETEKDCLDAFETGSDDSIVFDEVRNLTPAYHALNTMIEQCQTDYLVPLDADMVLYPGFLDRIKRAIDDASVISDPKWHSILFPLHDTLTDEKIMALKVFKTEVVKRIRYKDDPCPDIQHYRDLQGAGYHVVNLMHEEPIGDHVVRGSFYCYAKYRDLYTVLRAHPKVVLESHFKGGNDLPSRSRAHLDFFKGKYKETGNDDYLYCIAGMVEGLTRPLAIKSKDLGDRDMRIPVDDAERLYLGWAKKFRRVFI